MKLWMLDTLFNFGDPANVRRSGKPSRMPQPYNKTPQAQPDHSRSMWNFESRCVAQSSMGGEQPQTAEEVTLPEGTEDAQLLRDAPELSHEEKEKAAAMIQRNYRGYKVRREVKGIGMSPSTRWTEAIKEWRYREMTRPMSREEELKVGDEHERARRNWKRIGAIAERAIVGDPDDEDLVEENLSLEESQEHKRRRHEARLEREKTAKQMDLQYWLEMVDQKHRYGSNLRAYHAEWQKADTHENFFFWLDKGAGKYLEIPICTRARLDLERVRYLSREERQNYLVAVDKEGKLCWAHNGMRITTSTDFKDSVDGVVPRKDIEHKPWSSTPLEQPGAFSDDEDSNLSEDDHEAEHYVNHDLKKAKGFSKLKHVSASTILNRLLQKSVQPNSWIFVADTCNRLYVGIKQSGAFQHSSFLHGSRISAAGLIKIEDGQLRRLSPLSGHYRPPTKNFRQFVHSLKDSGVDMSHVSISRSYAVLVGLEMYVKTRKKLKHGFHHVDKKKEEVVHPEEVRRREEAAKDKSKSAEKERKLLEQQQQEQREMRRRHSLPRNLINKLKDGKPVGHPSQDPTMLEPQVRPLTTKHEDVESGIPPEGTR